MTTYGKASPHPTTPHHTTSNQTKPHHTKPNHRQGSISVGCMAAKESSAHYALCCPQVLCKKVPYLPTPSDPSTLPPEVALLDRQFRLLREDMLGPLRKELAALGLEPTHGAAAGAVSVPERPAGSQRNVYMGLAVLGTTAHPRPCIILSVQLPPSHKATQLARATEREAFWKEFGKGTLPIDGLVCLVVPGRPLVFGTVVRREPREMAERRPLFGIAFESFTDSAWVLEYLGQPGGMPKGSCLVQVRAGK